MKYADPEAQAEIDRLRAEVEKLKTELEECQSSLDSDRDWQYWYGDDS